MLHFIVNFTIYRKFNSSLSNLQLIVNFTSCSICYVHFIGNFTLSVNLTVHCKFYILLQSIHLIAKHRLPPDKPFISHSFSLSLSLFVSLSFSPD